MKKPVFFLIILGLFVVSLVAGYLYLKETKKPKTSDLNIVPLNAFMVFETNSVLKKWKNQSVNSQIFEAVRVFEPFKKIDSLLVSLDSTVSKNQQLLQYFELNPSYVALIKSGAKKYDFLFAANIFSLTEQQLQELLLSSINEKAFQKSSKIYEGAEIISYKSKASAFHYTAYNQVFYLSKNQILVEEAVRHLNSENSLLSDQTFNRLYQTTGLGNDGHLYINAQEISDAMLSLQQKTSNGNNSLNLGNWCALDLFLKPNEVILSGFFHANDSTNSFLSRFAEQKSYKAEAAQIIPSSTAYWLAFSSSNFQKYLENYINEINATGNSFDKITNQFEPSLGKETIKNFMGNIQNEMGVFITEPILGNIENNSFAYFKLANVTQQIEWFNSVSITIDSIETDNGFQKIRQINQPSFLHQLFGSSFKLINKNYFVFIKNFVVFGNHSTDLKELIRSFAREKTLKKDLRFAQFSENLSNDFNSMVYLNIARCPNLIEPFIERETAFNIQKNLDFFRQFEGLAIQFSNNGNSLFYTNIYFNHNPVYTQETGALWAFDLDTQSIQKPFVFVNHYTKSKEIFTQDLKNNIYLLSNTGKLIWKKQVNQQITGEVFMVDAFNNRKFQLLFNTKTHVYLIDRNGENVSPFPLEFKEEIATSISAIDYDKNHSYRILIPLKNGEILNYDVNGKKVQGWDYKKDTAITQKPSHFKIGNNDYITAFDKQGNLKFLNRKGEVRLQLKNKISNPNENYFLEVGLSKRTTHIYQIDSLGNLFVVSLEDNVQNISTQINEKCRGFTGFMMPEVNKTYLLQVNAAGLLFTENNLSTVFQTPLKLSQPYAPQAFVLPNQEFIFSVTDQAKNKIYLVNRFGALFEDYPFTGSTPIIITDINNDGKPNLVASSADAKIFVYALQ